MMFEGSLVESTTLLRSRSRWPVLASLATQAAVAAVLIALPLLHPELLTLHAPSFVLRAPPPPPPSPPTRPPSRVRSVPDAHGPAILSAAAPRLAATLLRNTLVNPSSSTDTPGIMAMADGMVSRSITALGAMLGAGESTANVSVMSGSPAAPGHISLSSGVTAGLLLAPIEPEYPAIAKAARQQGTVIVRAIISRTGIVQSAHVLSGPAVLQAAALRAVEHARYRPYLLNGQPTEVDTTVTINFRLGS